MKISRIGAKASKGFGQFMADKPGIPPTPSASRTNDTTVSVSWTGDILSNGDPVTTLEWQSSPSIALTYTNTDLISPVTITGSFVEGTSYDFRFRATNGIGTSDWSSYSNGVTVNPFDAPSAPVGVTASVSTATNVSISWTSLNQGDAAVTSNTITSSPSISLTYTSSDVTSPISVTGTYALNTSYTFSLRFTNTYGTGPSASSNAVTPNSRKLCTSAQITLGCCTSTTDCGAEGGGSNCTTLSGTIACP